MFFFYVLSFFKKGDTIQGEDIIQGNTVYVVKSEPTKIGHNLSK